MKHSMMRVAVAATLGFAALAANAGTLAINTGAVLAAEYVGATTVVNQPNITFQTANLLVANTAVTFHVRFSAGTVATLPLATDITVSGAGGAVSAIAADADNKGYSFVVTTTATGLPSGTTVSVSNTTAQLTGLNTALASGGSVTAAVGYTSTPGDYAGVSSWIETPVSATLLTSSASLSQTVVSSSKFTVAEAKAVDVTAASPMTQFNTATSNTAGTNLLNLGSVALKISTAVQTPTGGTPAVGDFGSVSFTATGDFSVGTASLSTNATCTAPIGAATVTPSTDKKSVTFSTVPVATIVAAPVYVCYTLSGATKQIPFPVQYAIGSASLLAGGAGKAAAVSSVSSGGNAYLLGSNGASVVVPSFVPSTGTPGNGYNTYLRVINTGTSTADISVSAYNSSTGVVGTAAKLISQLAPNASAMLDTNTVVTALGLTGGWSSLVVSGPTSKLAVQPLLVNPVQGVITNLSAVNGSNNAATAN